MNRSCFLLLGICLLFSCKKKDEPTNEPVPVAEIPASGSSYYDALFTSTKIYSKSSGTVSQTSTQSTAYYSGEQVVNEAYKSSALLNIGAVKLNGVTFKSKSSLANNYYSDSTGTVFNLPHYWKVEGKSPVDSFSFSNPGPYPLFTYTSLPDSFSVTNGLQIKIKKTLNCTMIRLFVTDAGSAHFSNKFYSGSDTVLVVQPEELTDFNKGIGYYTLSFYNDNYRKINSKTVNFRTAISYANMALKFLK